MRLADVDVSKLSPMMQKYVEVKKNYLNHIVFYRLGDFYEMFFDDAVIVSRELELTLTGRDCGLEERAPMCGVPHHACDVYLKKLIDKGFMVAICEQTEDPSQAQGLVKREVVRVVTPGTLIESSMLDETQNNYICSAFYKDDEISLCMADISTGEVHLYLFSGKDAVSDAVNELSRFEPVEVLINDEVLKLKAIMSFIKEKLKSSVSVLVDKDFAVSENKDIVCEQFSVSDISTLSVNENNAEINSVCGLFKYIYDTQKSLIGRFTNITKHENDPLMTLGFTARRNLELTETLRNKEKKGSLLWVLDKNKTSMGKRLLKTFIDQPLTNPAKIIQRLDAVEQLTQNPVALGELSEALAGIYDIERLMTRVMYKTATPRDLNALSATAGKLPEIKRLLSAFSSKLLINENSKISTLEDIANLIDNSIVDEPPVNIKDGGVIKDGFNEKLDELRDIIHGGKSIIENIAERERERTGIKTLKIGYNRVFGYYIEVTKSNISLVPESYIRKQTLTNCERYITEELKDAENTILSANDKVISLEQDIFVEVRDYIAKQLVVVQETASALALIDVLASFASVAISNNYSKPEIAIDGVIDIKKGRHPVVELMQKDEMFVPNDTYLDLTENKMSIITGPNMSGKSTYMRQIALITLMAQIGSFVPAEYAKISVVDQIFTRVGASDDLTSGQSTFMVEMSEVAEIVKNATKNSLVILDEVGRGTSTFDGISIARSVAEYISGSKKLGCKTLFATHYHELIELENELEGVKNYSVAVKRTNQGIRFLRKIVRGGVDESYGIEVAKLAGLPSKIINRANELLKGFEEENNNFKISDSDNIQIDMDSINEKIAIEKLRKTNIDEMNDEELRFYIKDILKYI